MAKQLSNEQLQKFCEEKNIIFLDPIYINANTIYWWHCNTHDQDCQLAYNKLQQGRQLACCSAAIEVQQRDEYIKEAHELATIHGAIFHEDTFIFKHLKNKWTCKLHNTEINLSLQEVKLIQGNICPDCRKNNRALELAKQLQEVTIAAPNIVLMDEVFLGMNVIHTWYCKTHNYTGTNKACRIIQTKLRCCIDNHLTSEELQAFCAENDIIFLDDMYKGTATKHTWYCKVHDVKFQTTYNNIKQGVKSKCCHFSHRTDTPLQRGRQIALDNNLIFHEDTFTIGRAVNKWSCKIHNNEFEYSVLHIQNIDGPKCPDCRREQRQQRLEAELQSILIEVPHIEFVDDEYTGQKYSHKWRCKIHDHVSTSRGSSVKKTKRLKCCVWEANSGENHTNYNKKVPNESRTARGYVLGQVKWNRLVKTRDNHECTLCKSTDRLHAHHLYSWIAYPDLRFDVTNGVTLCKGCHEQFHSMYGRVDNTKEQFEEFKIIRLTGEDPSFHLLTEKLRLFYITRRLFLEYIQCTKEEIMFQLEAVLGTRTKALSYFNRLRKVYKDQMTF